MKLKLLIGLALLASLGTAHAESLPELQSRCANDAAAFVDRYAHRPLKCAFVGGCGDQSSQIDPPDDYVNNYSEVMNGCFIVIKEAYGSHRTDPDDKRTYFHHVTTYTLYGVNTHRAFGSFAKIKTNDPIYKSDPNYKPDGSSSEKIECDFNNIECSSESEWDAKVTPYVPGWKS